ncbi:MAG: DUF4097 family beta strand repeat protein [Deltaproteobacteria bacterium]|nr:DUF4097 family beta strand repeat protein [Deltaproteobacteria bacterium]
MKRWQRNGLAIAGWLVPMLPHVPLARAQEVADDLQVERDSVEIAPHRGVRIRALDVENRLGDVTVLGHDAPSVTLSVVKRAPDGETLDRLKVNLVPDPAGSIHVGTALLIGKEARPIPVGSVRIDLALAVPRDARVEIRAWNGKLTVAGIRGGARLSANEGEITVTDVRGTVATSNARGRQELRAVRGAVALGNAFGEVSLDEISGDSLAASVHEGTVVATQVRSSHVKIRTTYGQVLFQGELLAGGRYDIRSYQGDITIRFRQGPKVALEAISRDGVVESHLDDSQMDLAGASTRPAGRLVGTYGSSRRKPALLEVLSVTGRVTLGLLNE